MSSPPLNRRQRRAAESAPSFPQAVQAHQAGDLAAAERLYRRLLAAEPRHVDALCNLALIAFAGRRLDEAAGLFEQAARARPDAARAHAGLGGVRRELGQLEAAATSLAEAVRLNPADWQSRLNLGLTLRGLGRDAEAKPQFAAVLQVQPGDLQARFHLAVIRSAEGEREAALAEFAAILQQQPGLAEVWLEVGLAQQALGRPAEAAAAYEQAIQAVPAYTPARFNLASLMQSEGRYAEAEAGYRQLLAIDPAHLPARLNLALALLQLGRREAAVACHHETLRIFPENPDALCGLADAERLLGRLDEAVELLRRAARARPDSAVLWKGLGVALQQVIRLDEAVVALSEAVRLDPGPISHWIQLAQAKARACDWAGLEEIERTALGKIGDPAAGLAPPFGVLTLDSSPEQQLASARRWSAEVARAGQPLPARPPHGRERLRIGYLSADFRHHATALLATGLFEAHDRQRFEVIAYSLNPSDGSDDRRRLEAAFDRFVDLQPLSHGEAARRIHEDEIDILVDLKGYTNEARPEILAHRPAPIQVNYLGYPGTMGADFIDYILVDPVVGPHEMAPFFSEALAQVPGSYQANMPRPLAVDPHGRAGHGLPEDGFVFCSFNGSYKITPRLFDIWMRLLQQAPGSVLWLLDWNATASANLRREAAARGVDPQRLVFARPMRSADHLARHRHADLFLDTLPVCAHTTASDALWAGLPVLSCKGRTFVSRVSAGLLAALGLPELVTEDLADYEARALRLAASPAELAALRERLWAARETTGVFDPADIARRVEAVYAEMWRRHRAGEPPAAILAEAGA